MRIVVMSWLERRSRETFLDRRVAWRPDLAARPPAAAAAELAALQPEVVIVRRPDAARLRAIEAAAEAGAHAGRWHSIVCDRFVAGSPASGAAEGSSLVGACSWQAAEHEAFLLAEALCRPQPAVPARTAPSTREVLMVGAGIVNMVTALVLQQRGHAVEIFDRMSDPLRGAVRHAGASFAGKDARVFSFNESRHHLAAPAGGEFRRTLDAGGWLSRPFDRLSRADRAWVAALESVPPWLAQQYGNDIVGFNQRSEAGWRRLFSLHPELLREVHHVGRLLRTYPSAASLAAAREVEAGLGALLGELDGAALAAAEPALAGAVERGAVAGALQVRGFSLSLHRFGRNLIRLLQQEGARFHWEQPLEELRTDAQGRAAAVVIGGQTRRLHDAVISPGAFGGAVRGRLAALPAIGAMAGAWVTLPNDGMPLSTPLKVRRRGFASDAAAQGANVVPARDAQGRPVLHCSSGHGFIGLTPSHLKTADTEALARCALETAEDLFPDQLQRARRSGLLDGPPCLCVRPWTPSGLGLFELQPTASGGLLLMTGGHNTGGFAQSPQVAEAVAAALDGRTHAMHTLYHPARFDARCEEAA